MSHSSPAVGSPLGEENACTKDPKTGIKMTRTRKRRNKQRADATDGGTLGIIIIPKDQNLAVESQSFREEDDAARGPESHMLAHQNVRTDEHKASGDGDSKGGLKRTKRSRGKSKVFAPSLSISVCSVAAR